MVDVKRLSVIHTDRAHVADDVIASKINGVGGDEMSHLKGTTSNIQDWIDSSAITINTMAQNIGNANAILERI